MSDTEKCEKCGGRTALVGGYWNYSADSEPYVSGIEEEAKSREGDVWLNGFRCDKCNHIQGLCVD